MAGKIITDAGINELAKLLAGQGTAFAYIALGTGTTGPRASDISLQAEVIRKPVTNVTINGNEVEFETVINPGDIVDKSITEIGLFNAATGGVMYYREVRNALYFDATVGAVIKIKCSFSRS